MLAQCEKGRTQTKNYWCRCLIRSCLWKSVQIYFCPPQPPEELPIVGCPRYFTQASEACVQTWPLTVSSATYWLAMIRWQRTLYKTLCGIQVRIFNFIVLMALFFFRKCGKIYILGNDTNKSRLQLFDKKVHSREFWRVIQCWSKNL
jgi:hypothetical protein